MMRGTASLLAAAALPSGFGLPQSPPSWVATLEAEGYVVQEGQYSFFDVDRCSQTDTCYALNPLTPYGLMYLPPHPNETATAVSYENSCQVHGMCKQVDGVTWGPGWRIAPGETVVLVGRTPPQATYWSFGNYLFSRFHEPGWQPSPSQFAHRIVACPEVPKDKPGERCEIFAGVNDPLNHLTVNTPSPFDADFSLVLSWDPESEDKMTQHLEAAGAGPVNSLRFPSEVLRLGVTRGDEDEFLNLLRVEGVADEAARQAFYKDAPFRIFRVSPGANIPAPTSQWPSFDGNMRVRTTGQMEGIPGVVTAADLQDGLDKMQSALLKKLNVWNVDDYVAVSFQSFVKDSGYECLNEGTRCQGDCRDTIYARATLIVEETICNATHLPCKPSRRSELTTQAGDAYYVLGVNHERTQQALYSSLTLYNFPRLMPGTLRLGGRTPGQYTLVDRDYRGSAVHLLPEGHPAAPYLYAVKLARVCAAEETELCMQVPSTSDDPNEIALPLDSKLVFLERMYIHPGKTSGPAVNETVFSKLVHVRSRFGSAAAERVIV